MNRPVVIEGAVLHESINCKKGVEIHHILAAVVKLVRIRITRVELVLLCHHHVGQHTKMNIGHIVVHHMVVHIGGRPGEGLDRRHHGHMRRGGILLRWQWRLGNNPLLTISLLETEV